MDLLLFVQEDEANVGVSDSLIDLKKGYELNLGLQTLNELQLKPNREDVARLVAGENKSLLVRYVLRTLQEGFLQDLLMVLTVHFGHQPLDLLIPHLKGLIAEDPDCPRISLGDIP